MSEKMWNTSEQTPKIKHSEAYKSLTELIEKIDLYHEATDDETSKDMELLLREYRHFKKRKHEELRKLKDEVSKTGNDIRKLSTPEEGKAEEEMELEIDLISDKILDKIASDAFRKFAKRTNILEWRFEEEWDHAIDYDPDQERFLPTFDTEAISEEFMIFCEDFWITREELIRKLNAKIEAIRQAELDKHKEQLLNRDDKKPGLRPVN